MKKSGINYSENITALPFHLDIGFINESVSSEYRKNLIVSIYAQQQYGESRNLLKKEIEEAFNIYADNPNRIKKFIKRGEEIRFGIRMRHIHFADFIIYVMNFMIVWIKCESLNCRNMS